MVIKYQITDQLFGSFPSPARDKIIPLVFTQYTVIPDGKTPDTVIPEKCKPLLNILDWNHRDIQNYLNYLGLG